MEFLRILGALLILLVLLDVFLTVLYARVGAGVVSRRLACPTWWSFRTLAKPSPRRRDAVLSFCGPTILVLLVGLWVLGLTGGAALVIWPSLASGGVAPTSGASSASKDFTTALYVAGEGL